ncbi:hypothetical protein D3C77_803010 [compost metagenome]
MKVHFICDVFLVEGVANDSFFNIVLFIDDQTNRKKCTATTVDPESLPKRAHETGDIEMR